MRIGESRKGWTLKMIVDGSVAPPHWDESRVPVYDDEVKQWVKLGPRGVRDEGIYTSPAGVGVTEHGLELKRRR